MERPALRTATLFPPLYGAFLIMESIWVYYPFPAALMLSQQASGFVLLFLGGYMWAQAASGEFWRVRQLAPWVGLASLWLIVSPFILGYGSPMSLVLSIGGGVIALLVSLYAAWDTWDTKPIEGYPT